MKYKFVAVDMDGTLLNSEGLITEKTIEAITGIVDKGVIFTISTAGLFREWRNIIRYFG